MLKLKILGQKSVWCGLGLMIVLLTAPTLTVRADTAINTLNYSNVFAFNGTQTSAGVTEAIISNKIYLYGTSPAASRSSGGLIYRTTTDGQVVTLYELKDTDGYSPVAGLLLGNDNNLYGATNFGPRVGANLQAGTGTIYRIALDGTGYTTLHTFDAFPKTTTGDTIFLNNDGAYPQQQLIEDQSGNLYGVTKAGGANGTGTVFRMQSDGSNFQVLYAFAALNPFNGLTLSIDHQGASPSGPLMIDINSGYLYGVTSGGGDWGTGTVYRVQTDGTQFQTLFTFELLNGAANLNSDSSNCHGATPNGRLLMANGKIYGTTTAGGNDSGNCGGNATGAPIGYGTVFSFDVNTIPAGGLLNPDQFVIAHNFTGGDGQGPKGDLVLGVDTLIYGMTVTGTNSTSPPFSVAGTVFTIDPAATDLTQNFNLAHGFAGGESSGVTGYLIQGRDGYFYGTAIGSGGCGGGAVFQLRNDSTFSQAGYTNCNNPNTTSSSSPYGGGGAMNYLFLWLLVLIGFVPLVWRKLFSV